MAKLSERLIALADDYEDRFGERLPLGWSITDAAIPAIEQALAEGSTAPVRAWIEADEAGEAEDGIDR